MLGVALTVTVVRAVNGIQIEDGLYTAYFAIASWVSGGRWSIATDRRRYVLLTLGLLALVYGSRFLISGSYESLSPVTWQHPCFYLSLFVLLYFVGDAEVNDTRLRA